MENESSVFETRKPKDKIAETMAAALDVPTFALEDEYGLKISNIDGRLCITPDKEHPSFLSFFGMLSA